MSKYGTVMTVYRKVKEDGSRLVVHPTPLWKHVTRFVTSAKEAGRLLTETAVAGVGDEQYFMLESNLFANIFSYSNLCKCILYTYLMNLCDDLLLLNSNNQKFRLL